MVEPATDNRQTQDRYLEEVPNFKKRTISIKVMQETFNF